MVSHKMIKIYNFKSGMDKEWYCRGESCGLFFALVNSGVITDCFKWMKTNESQKEKTLEEQLAFELKVMAEWALVTGLYPSNNRETFHVLYSRLMKLVSEEKKNLDAKIYNKKLAFLKKNIETLEKFYREYEKNSLDKGTVVLGNHITLETEKFKSIESLPEHTILWVEGNWVVYLRTTDGKAVTADSKNSESLVTYPAEHLEGCTIIKPEKISIDKKITWTLDDFENNPDANLQNSKRMEFSKKMRDVLEKLDYINFTQKDYNRILKKAKNALESLDKEHYRYD